MNKQTKGEFSTLNPEHELFNALAIKKNPPAWWREVLADNDLYVEVRKDNYINVYYYGGCVMKIRYNKTSKSLIVETHQKYMGDYTSIKKDKKGNDVFEYRNCTKEIEIPNYLLFLKENIKEIYLKENQAGTDKLKKDKLRVSSEKKAQGELMLKNRHLFIDSEFAYKLSEENKTDKIIRFDLVQLEEGVLKFIELKLISDPRLRGKNIDIIKQMTKYNAYIDKKKNEFVDYYKKVATIKYKIGVLKEEPIIQTIDIKPGLLLINNYLSPLTEGRNKRIEDIECVLKKEKIDYTIQDYSICK